MTSTYFIRKLWHCCNHNAVFNVGISGAQSVAWGCLGLPRGSSCRKRALMCSRTWTHPAAIPHATPSLSDSQRARSAAEARHEIPPIILL